MHFSRSALRVALLAAAVGLGLASCGGSDEPSAAPVEPAPGAASDSPPPGPTTEAEPAPQPATGRTIEPSADPGLSTIVLEEIAVLEQPLDLTTRANDPALYIAEKTGRVQVVGASGTVRTEPFLDLSDRVSTESERGLLGITFAPDGSRFYAHYSDSAGDSHLASWAVDGDTLDPGSELDHLVVAQPFANHNGGPITFGPDGFLYWGLGDGGDGGDPEENGQDRSTLLGSILRIEPLADEAEPYRVPPDNPFVGDAEARPEIWVWGVRNPWKLSFDADGGLWIGDVGQGEIEEIDFLPPAAAAGANLGWDAFEGTAQHEDEEVADAVPPVFEYGRDRGASITGGYVYRGAAIPALQGRYVFGDFASGFVAALGLADGTWSAQPLPFAVPQVASFGEDENGELYVLSLQGQVFRLAPG